MKYLKKDDEERKITTRQELLDYLLFREENDEWYEPLISECSAIAVANTEMEKAIGLKEHCIEGTEADMDCIENLGIFLSFPKNGKETILPLRITAFPGLCKVSGTNCRAVMNFVKKGKERLLPLKTKAEWITTGCGLSDQTCKILYRDEKITAVLTRRYEILPQWELVEALEDALGKEFDKFSFHEAVITHDYSSFNYRIEDQEIIDTFKGFLLQADISCEEVIAGVSLATSDIGYSKAYSYMYFEYNGIKVKLKNIAEIIHDYGNTVNDFREENVNISDGFREQEELFEELGNIPINDVGICIKNIIKKTKIFTEKAAEAVIEEKSLLTDGTAADVYLALFEIAEEQGRERSLKNRLDTMNEIAKLIHLDFQSFDEE